MDSATTDRHQFVSAEMEDYLGQMRSISQQQKLVETNIRARFAQAIANGFERRTADELISLDAEDERLGQEYVRLHELYNSAALDERRSQMLLAARNAGKTNVFPSPHPPLAARPMSERHAYLLPSTPPTNHCIDWELARDEIKLEDVTLGKGAFGTVTKLVVSTGVHLRQGVLRGKTVAVKSLPIVWSRNGEIGQRTTEVLNDFRNECAVMSKLLHPNVLLLMGVCIEQATDTLLMVTELMENGSMFDLLHRGKTRLAFKQRMRAAKDCALGMNHLHLNKPHPILSPVYGLKDTKSVGGTPFYMSPEALNEHPPDAKSDVYAFAIILWELVTQKVPYTDEKFRTDALGLAQLYCHVVEEKKRPVVPHDCPPKLAKLIEQCWAHDPADRPTFQEILDSRILDEVVLDDAISEVNALGRAFWRDSFVHQKELLLAVEWPVFARALASWCGIRTADGDLEKDIRWKALHMVLVPDHTSQVTLERFSAVLEWFGPFAKGDKLFKNVLTTIRIKGFYGDASSEQMGILLAGKAVGSYVIRFSGLQPGFFTITTLASKDNIQSFRISHSPGRGYWLKEDQVFPTLKKLVKTYQATLGLLAPLTGSKYRQLLVEFREGERDNVYDVLTPAPVDLLPVLSPRSSVPPAKRPSATSSPSGSREVAALSSSKEKKKEKEKEKEKKAKKEHKAALSSSKEKEKAKQKRKEEKEKAKTEKSKETSLRKSSKKPTNSLGD
ncbi:protein kinase domain containing protein [Acanthamoeba castellanii str. Neff]|uniref:Protein kinase domain containing protein n=1 Tax=Acanthamoeba castellanii (strain ATCC 30010 / Neff) TaxID=1257118 RepID=L8GV13_ACACF|nr:protein kinase domain containing protein [Acanthamoeba castellanii str. Neff]ELR16845.1 protein kinase domain containing protein [Acanthamoeba castellanii str. Neff]